MFVLDFELSWFELQLCAFLFYFVVASGFFISCVWVLGSIFGVVWYFGLFTGIGALLGYSGLVCTALLVFGVEFWLIY